jgi:hypothetical protein
MSVYAGVSTVVHAPITSLQDLMCCRDVCGVALFVHKKALFMKIADAAAVAADRQQPR